MLIDLVEANTGDIWNYPIAPTDARTTLEAFQTNSLPTDFTRLGITHINITDIVSNRIEFLTKLNILSYLVSFSFV